MHNINPHVFAHIQENILPKYDQFDKAHDRSHVCKVIANSLSIAKSYDVNPTKVFVIAAYHDVGLIHGRDNHEKTSAEYLLSDEALKAWFTDNDLTEIAEAIQDHRASSSNEPRSIYGKIVAEADRDIEFTTILTRIVQYSLSHYPNYTTQQHFDRAYAHLQEKYGEDGYLKLWLDTEPNRSGLAEIRKALRDKTALRAKFIELILHSTPCYNLKKKGGTQI